MPRFPVGDRVRVKNNTPKLCPETGTIVDISYFSEDPMPHRNPRVYVLQFEDGSERQFKDDEIEPE